MSDFSIGGALWPGISKLIEEAGEVSQVCGKLIGARGEVQHWDGTNLRDRLEAELADLMAACDFVIGYNRLDTEAIHRRRVAKMTLFESWQHAQPPLAARTEASKEGNDGT